MATAAEITAITSLSSSADTADGEGAGADFVMVGSLVAGSDEAEGDIWEKMYRTNEYEWEDANAGNDLNYVF